MKQLRVSADNGNAQAQNDLGVAYATGAGVMQDDEVAFWWYSKAADQGLPSAQFFVGGAYASGRSARSFRLRV